MSNFIPVLKDPEQQQLIPSIWRNTLSEIANAIARGDYQHLTHMSGVRFVSEDICKIIADNIEDYGVRLIELPEDSWCTSVCQWMDNYWDVLVDLFSVEEGASDLALAVRVYEVDTEYLFEIKSVYVP